MFDLNKENIDMSELTEFRKSKDEFFAADGHSPLTPQQQKSFRNLEYYPENPQLRFEVALEEFPDQEKEPTEIITSTGDSNTKSPWHFGQALRRNQLTNPPVSVVLE